MPSSEATRRQYLEAMGVTQWERRALASDAQVDTSPGIVAPDVIVPSAGASPDWTALEEAVRGCTKCALHSTRTQTVFGVGNRRAQWLFVG